MLTGDLNTYRDSEKRPGNWTISFCVFLQPNCQDFSVNPHVELILLFTLVLLKTSRYLLQSHIKNEQAKLVHEHLLRSADVFVQ